MRVCKSIDIHYRHNDPIIIVGQISNFRFVWGEQFIQIISCGCWCNPFTSVYIWFNKNRWVSLDRSKQIEEIKGILVICLCSTIALRRVYEPFCVILWQREVDDPHMICHIRNSLELSDIFPIKCRGIHKLRPNHNISSNQSHRQGSSLQF